MWAKRDVCVGYLEARPSRYVNVKESSKYHDRRMMMIQADSARQVLLWPLRWPRHYMDGRAQAYAIPDMRYDVFFVETIKIVKAAQDARRAGSSRSLRGTVWHNKSAVVVEPTMDNLFHMFFHALPLREDLAALRESLHAHAIWSAVEASRSSKALDWLSQPSVADLPDLLPRYTVLWPGPYDGSISSWRGLEIAMRLINDALQPLATTLAAPYQHQPGNSSAMARLQMASPQMASPQMASPQMASPQPSSIASGSSAEHLSLPAMKALLEPRTAQCYTLVVGGHSPFWPNLYGEAKEVHAVRPRLASMRAALWRTFRFSAAYLTLSGSTDGSFVRGAPPPPILFLTRRTMVRAIANEASLWHDLKEEDPWVSQQLHAVAFDGLSLREQLSLDSLQTHICTYTCTCTCRDNSGSSCLLIRFKPTSSPSYNHTAIHCTLI